MQLEGVEILSGHVLCQKWYMPHSLDGHTVVFEGNFCSRFRNPDVYRRFPAMIADGLDVFSAFRKSVRVAGSSFWIICGINFVVGLASIFAASVAGAVAGIISGILGLPGSSPVISTIITSFLTIVGAAVISARQFVLATARLMIYREKTGNGQ